MTEPKEVDRDAPTTPSTATDAELRDIFGHALDPVLSAGEFDHAGAVLGGHRWVGYERRSKLLRGWAWRSRGARGDRRWLSG
jgi:hypothetical protein